MVDLGKLSFFLSVCFVLCVFVSKFFLIVVLVKILILENNFCEFNLIVYISFDFIVVWFYILR